MSRTQPRWRLDRRCDAASAAACHPVDVHESTSRVHQGGSLAAEANAPYTAHGPSEDEPAPEPTLGGATIQLLARLMDLVQETAQLDLDAMSDEQVEGCLNDLRRPLAMLEATRSRLLANMEARAAQRVQPGRSVRGATDEQRRRSAQGQRMTRSRAKREAEAGHAAQRHHNTGTAFSQGDIGTEHVRLIADLLTHLPLERQAEAELHLLALAREHDPVGFGRRARALLHELEPDGTAAAERQQESRRELRVTDTPDGGLALSGRLHGTSAELVRVALDNFRRFDSPAAPRTVEQRNADAFLQLCEVALRSEEGPTRHGARPHVLVMVRAEDLHGGTGPARFGHSGHPVNLAQVRRLFSDSIVSRVAFAADGTPIEASAGVRTVPPGLYRALVARDGGCTWAGCDAPPSWCEVAHGNVPFRANEPLRLTDAALLCRRHHSRFDHGHYRMVVAGPEVTYLRLDDLGRPLGTPDGSDQQGDRAPELSDGTASGWHTPPPEPVPQPSRTHDPPPDPVGHQRDPVTDPVQDPARRPAHDAVHDPVHDPAHDPAQDPAHGPAHDPAQPARDPVARRPSPAAPTVSPNAPPEPMSGQDPAAQPNLFESGGG